MIPFGDNLMISFNGFIYQLLFRVFFQIADYKYFMKGCSLRRMDSKARKDSGISP
jgi:hypothetical protein